MIEGKRPWRPASAPGLTKKEFMTKVLGLESHTFNIGNAKYLAEYKIASQIQSEYRGRPDIAKAIRELSLPILTIWGYPSPAPGASIVDAREVYLSQQDITAAKKQILQLKENRKHMYALVIGQCLPNLESKLQGSATHAKADAEQGIVQLLLIIRG